MSDTRWTPGPWEWLEDRFNGGFSGLFANDEPVLYPQRRNDGDEGDAWFGTDEDYYGETTLKEPDAHLIAAAPDLYEALTQCLALAELQYGNMDDIASHVFGKCHTALAKARGKS